MTRRGAGRALRAGGAALLAALLATLPVTFPGGPPRAQDAPDVAAGPPGDPLAGRKVARACAQCHGIDGIARQPDAANLAGQDAGYLVRQLAAFRSGERHNDIMNAMAGTLDDQQMRDVAAYFGGITIAVKSVPGQ